MKKLESNLLSEMLNPTCKSNEEQDNNDTSGTKGSTKSKSRKTGSSKESNKKRPRSGRQKVSISSCACLHKVTVYVYMVHIYRLYTSYAVSTSSIESSY